MPKVSQTPGLPESLTTVPGFSDLHTRYSLISSLFPLSPEGEVWLDHTWRVRKFSAGKPGIQTFTLESRDNRIQDVSGYLKVTHLLDPIHWIRGNYESGSASSEEKLNSPHNQAYVEAFAAFLTGKLREEDFSPHFHLFYGAFTAKAATYAYNISDAYSSYRHCRWFWKGRDEGLFSLGFSETVPADIRDALLALPDYLTDDESEDSEDDAETSSSSEIEVGKEGDKVELTSIHSASLSDMETDEDDSSEDDSLEASDTTEDSNEIDLFAEIRNFPVMIICTESSSGTLDTLLENHEAVGCRPGTAEWEHKWTAWIFQVIAALCQIQSLFGMTHNDLHTNNIVWSKTDSPFLYYSSRDGRLWKIPTFGCIFRIIDFGRSIFKVNGQLYYSDDFAEGNDAADQYNFGPLLDDTKKVVEPNPSFDLSRFAVSVFEALFPRPPAEKKEGGILSAEPGLLVMETDSDLYNMLWSWMVCEDGRNVLMEPDGRERYPDFTLYKVIAEEVHGAVPKEQIRRPLFDTFRIKKKQLPKEAKVYSLFV